MPQELPEPMTPPDADLRRFDRFMLDVQRLLGSELVALATGEEFKAAVLLWCRAWQQVPAGSLPDDDRLLAIWSGAGKKWPKVKGMALRGFVKCSDSRIYHRVLCEDVNRALKDIRGNRERTSAATEAKKAKKNNDTHQRNDQRNDHRDDQRNGNVTTVVTVTPRPPIDRTGQEEDIRTLAAAVNLTPAPAREPPTAAAAADAVQRVQALFEDLNNPNIVNFRYVHLWVEQGCDVDQDILPAIRETTRRQLEDSPDWFARELKYYDGAVHDWRRKRTAPLNRLGPRAPRLIDYDPQEAIAAGTAAADARLGKDDL